jgi:hypothetical protein
MDSRKLVFILLSVAATGAHAQTAGVVTLRANQTSATGSQTPVLTWSTNPVAQSCRASGGWSGDKAASGTQTLPSINASTNFTLTCSWSGGTALVRWTAPTQNSNGSALTNLGSFRIVYGTSASGLTQSHIVSDVTARQATIQSLAPGTWYFAVRARTTSNVESSDSNVATKNVTGATSAGSVAITITPTTPPPTTPPPTTPPPTTPPPTGSRQLRVAAPDVGDIVGSGSSATLGRKVGTIAVGTACDPTLRVSGWYRVPRAQVTITTTPRSTDVVAQCSWSQ